MEFICKKEYALTPDERELVGDMIFAGDYTQKQKDILNGIARRWPERWYRGHKQHYATIHQIANCPLFFEGKVDAVNYFSLTANWAKAYPHIVLALSEGIDTAPAPIDWEQEYANILELREKAIEYLHEYAPTLYTKDFCHRQDSAYLIKKSAKYQQEIAGGQQP